MLTVFCQLKRNRRLLGRWLGSLRASTSAAFACILFALTTSANAHIVGDWQQLKQTGAIAPFGRSTNRIYTEVWGEQTMAFVGSNDLGVAIVDISNPASLFHLGTYNHELLGEVSDVKSAGDVGFFSSANGGGIHLADLALPETPSVLSIIDASNQGFSSVAETLIDDGLLYSVSDGSSLVKVFDVSQPRTPKFVAEFDTHDSIGLLDVRKHGEQLYLAGAGGHAGEGAVYIYDVANVREEIPRMSANFASGPNTSSIAPSRDASKLFVTHLELGGSLDVWDISNLNEPKELTSATIADVNDNSFGTSEVMVLDQVAYVAWFQAGIQAVDFDTFAGQQLQFVGGYDTSPTSSPLDGEVGNRSVYSDLGHDRILVSDTQWGLFVVDATNAVPQLGDLNQNGTIDVGDLDILTLVIREGDIDLRFDMNRDGEVTPDDRRAFITNIANSTFGDSNFDGRFDSSDLVFVFIGGKYEDEIPLNATWDSGDWNGDGDFTTGDLIAAFQAGSYELDAATVVPEPGQTPFCLSLFLWLWTSLRRDGDT